MTERKLTPEIRESVLMATAAGMYRDMVARYAGISPATLHRWLARGKRNAFAAPKESGAKAGEETSPAESLSECGELYMAVIRAETLAVMDSLNRIRKHAERNWQADAWLLERRYAELYGSHSREIREMARELAELRKLVESLTGEKAIA
jgi:hypothetical protein